ncbi:MAG: leucine-rich repeat domain-containing protein [Clostridia bacterium]|nr:leucine-rich repeat domain-containing protein [Clostridia bacterium]
MENEKTTDIKLISDREQKEYLPLCPVQVQKNTITENEGKRMLQVSVTPCTDKTPLRCRLTLHFTDARRADAGTDSVHLTLGEETVFPCPDNAVYVHSLVEQVWQEDDLLWERGDRMPLSLPEQAILWQTDPLYDQIRRECEGVVQPVFRPDTVEGLWRCTCGQINLEETGTCGRCHTGRKWLDEHFDEAYLTEEKRIHDEMEAKNPAKKITVSRSKIESDRMKMIAIFAGMGAALLLVILTVTLIIPSIRYSKADRLLSDGEFDGAIALFTDLENFRDAEERAADATYKKAQNLTGLEEVYLTTSAEQPCFSITEDGILSLRKDDYTGSWDHFVVPDMVDGIIVRELDKNFFLNCKDLVEVTLSDCLEVLGEQTFFNCESLTTVNFGANLHTLGPRTFINCYALTEITIPDTITKIGLRAFNSCTSLRVVHLGSGITKVPSYLFSCCYSLERVSFGAPITAIDEFAFSECPALKKIYYTGTAAEWKAVVIGDENEALNGVEVVFEK